jgi:hypothetical protein
MSSDGNENADRNGVGKLHDVPLSGSAAAGTVFLNELTTFAPAGSMI